MLHKTNQNRQCTGIVAAIEVIKSIFQIIKMLLIDGVTLILSVVYEFANHGSYVVLDRKNKQNFKCVQFLHVAPTTRCYRVISRYLSYFVTYGHKCGATVG